MTVAFSAADTRPLNDQWLKIEDDVEVRDVHGNVLLSAPPVVPTGVARQVFEHVGARAMSYAFLLMAVMQHDTDRRTFSDPDHEEEVVEFDDAESLAKRLIEIDLDAGELYVDPRSQLLRIT